MRAVSRHWSFVCAFALVISGVAYAKDKPIAVKPGRGFAFGNFDLSDSEVAVDSVHLVRINKFYGFSPRPWESGTVTYTRGEFFSPSLKPGIYRVSGFRSGGVHFYLEDAHITNTFEVVPGGVVYAGTYKLRADNGALFRRPKGSFERVDSPESEINLLRWLSGELGTSGWSSAVKARLQQLLPPESGEPKSAALSGTVPRPAP